MHNMLPKQCETIMFIALIKYLNVGFTILAGFTPIPQPKINRKKMN